MMNISFVPSVCIHRSIILIFMEEKYANFFPHGKYFFPRFSIFLSARILVSVTNSRHCLFAEAILLLCCSPLAPSFEKKSTCSFPDVLKWAGIHYRTALLVAAICCRILVQV